MSWLARLTGREKGLDAAEAEALRRYRSLPRLDVRRPHCAERMVVVDVETSGLDPFRDRLLSIGALAVSDGLARFDQSFAAILRQEQPSAHENILVHGIGGTVQRSGCKPSAALLDFLLFSGSAPLVAFHADFDRIVIARAATSAIGVRPNNIWLDLAHLAPALFPQHARTAKTLDDWAGIFGIDNYARHDALADALATAQLLLVVLAKADADGARSCADLVRLDKNQRWLGPS
jgi:DNA polymerase-3 subunit epsilon